MAMMPANRMADQSPVTAAGLDPESAWWLGVLAETGPRREAALARLHELLVRVARAEAARRGPRVRITGPEVDDLGVPVCHLRGVGQDRTALLAPSGRAAGRRGLGPAAGPVRFRPRAGGRVAGPRRGAAPRRGRGADRAAAAGVRRDR